MPDVAVRAIVSDGIVSGQSWLVTLIGYEAVRGWRIHFLRLEIRRFTIRSSESFLLGNFAFERNPSTFIWIVTSRIANRF